MAKRLSERDRFMCHVRVGDPSACWTWTAYRLPHGYGFFRYPGRHELAHRVAYRLWVGAIPKGMDVMHSCDNPSCVNPDHLSLGSRVDNMQDAKRKGRTARGSGHGRSKLTDADIAFVKTSHLLQREIAAAVGTTQSHVSAIRAGKRWAFHGESI